MQSGVRSSEPGLPHQERAIGEVARRPHDPVVVAGEVLHDVPAAVDRDALEAGTRLGIRRVHRHPLGRAGEQLVD